MRLNKVCDLADFDDSEAIAMIRWLEPDLAAAFPGYPKGREHRKSWEHQHILRGCLALNAFEGAQTALIANAGDERIIFALTHYVPEVHALDNYGPNNPFLTDPRSRAHFPFDPTRLHLRHLDPEAPLLYPDQTFDLVLDLRFSTHPTYELAQSAFNDLARVLKPGGHLILVTDMVIDNGPPTGIPGAILHSPESFDRMIAGVQGVGLAESISTDVGPQSHDAALSNVFLQRGRFFPHTLLRAVNRLFTSGVIHLRAA